MKKIQLNHWWVDNNKLSISLLRYYVDIHTTYKDSSLSYLLRVINNNQEQLIFSFSTLEEAITFTEDTINECKEFQEITEFYQNKRLSEEQPKRKKKAR